MNVPYLGMQTTVPFSTTVSLPPGGLNSRRHLFPVQVPLIPEALRPGLAACSSTSAPLFTRGEMAAVFGVAKRSIARWETSNGLSNEHENSRVLRYNLSAIVGLVAIGRTLVLEKADELGLNAKAIIALASAFGPRPKAAPGAPVFRTVILVPSNAEDRLLIAAWSDDVLKQTLVKIVRGLLEQPPAAA